MKPHMVWSVPTPRVTTPNRLRADLEASLAHQQQVVGIEAGETVGDFFKAVVRAGIPLSDPLASIEFGNSQCPTGRLVAERDEHGHWEIREARRS